MGSLFGGAPQQARAPDPVPMPTPPEPAKVEAPVVMPIKDDLVDKQYEQKQIAIARRGKTNRANTIIGGEDTLGAG